jgi:hypothetical protein
MSSLIVPRRRFLRGLASLAVCAPPVVRASSLMPISARHYPCAHAAPPWATPENALALLQHELERRFAESLFGAEGLSPEAENGASPRSCPLKYGPVFSRYWNPPPAAWARSHGRRGSPAPALRWAKAFCAPFDNLSRSWDINPSTVPRSRSRVNREHGRSFRRSVAAPATVSGVPTHLSPLDFSQVREGGVGDTLRARRPAVRRRIPQNRRRGGRGVLMTGPQNPDLALRQLLAGSD